jgi:hypothetical protein
LVFRIFDCVVGLEKRKINWQVTTLPLKFRPCNDCEQTAACVFTGILQRSLSLSLAIPIASQFSLAQYPLLIDTLLYLPVTPSSFSIVNFFYFANSDHLEHLTPIQDKPHVKTPPLIDYQVNAAYTLAY